MAKLLSILTVTKAEPFACRFLRRMSRLAEAADAEFVIAGDGAAARLQLRHWGFTEDAIVVSVESAGFLESVLEAAVRCCSGKYILRLDDDEAASEAMERWVCGHQFTEETHWKFPRMHLWGGTSQVLLNGPLWPDHQTRLSIRKKAGGRHTVHAGSPFGGGVLAPVAIEHHKFLVKTAAERLAIAQRYDRIHAGYGTGGFLPFNLPEEAFSELCLEKVDAVALRAERDAIDYARS